MSDTIRIKGKVTAIGELVERGDFRKRDLVVKESGEYGQIYAIEFTKEKESELDFIEVGDGVVVDCNLRGREWDNGKGEKKHFLSLAAWKIQKV